MNAPRRSLALLGALSLAGSALGADTVETVLETRRLHLGKPGQWEWAEFQNRAVDAVRWERRFPAKANAAPQTLRIWQRDVKLAWPVKLNGRNLGNLVTSESALENVLEIPPGALLEGENVLTIDAPAALDDIEIGPISLVAKPINEVLSGAKIDVTITDASSGSALPCRLTVIRDDDTLQPLRAEPAGDVAVRTGVVYTRNGRATLSLPPGYYTVFAGRGFEWNVERTTVVLVSGETRPIALRLRRVVNTAGWIAADSHIHTLTHSGHGDATVEERLLTIAGEGIELAIATDHNHHTDYAPLMDATGAAKWFTPVVGNEVTTNYGHFNAFPISPGAKEIDPQQDGWIKMLAAMRATPGVKVITLNHPRDMHSGFIPFGPLNFNPRTGSHRGAEALRSVDAIEVITSGALQSDIELLYRDWFALLNRGHRIAAIASSDTHDVSRFILGQGRTYVAAKDGDPTKLDLDEVWRSYQEGRLLVSLGLLAQIKVDDRFGVGDLATGLGDSLKVEVTVSGPSWTKADHVALYANGLLLRAQKITEDFRAGEKARVVWRILKPAHDTHLVAIATGPGVTAPFWEIPRPYQPSSKSFIPRVIGSTNPVWLDADGDGRFASALALAQSLIQRHGGDRVKVRAALKDYDEAVATQVDSLLGAAP